MQQKYRLTKKERISSKKEIDLLFTEGNSFIVYPLRVVYMVHHCEEISGEFAISIMVSIPKKKFKRAVKRNRLRRLIKESYRLNKNDFAYPPLERTGGGFPQRILVAFLYLSDEEKAYVEIESAVRKALKTLSTKILQDD